MDPKGGYEERCSWLFAEDCQRSCQDSCRASSNDTLGGIEPSAISLWLFVIIPCMLKFFFPVHGCSLPIAEMFQIAKSLLHVAINVNEGELNCFNCHLGASYA